MERNIYTLNTFPKGLTSEAASSTTQEELALAELLSSDQVLNHNDNFERKAGFITEQFQRVMGFVGQHIVIKIYLPKSN